MKKLSFFLMAMLMSVMSFAQVVTFSPANETAVESQTFTLTSGDVTLVCSSGTITADQFRFFKNQTVTISSTGGNIVSVEFTCTASDGAKYGPGCFTTTSGDYTYAGKVGTWTGEANEVKFTASSNQVRATQVVVTLLAAGGVPQPSIQGATDFIESAEVSIVASEGLKVYYTLDGTDPTTESTEYTAPFTVEETTTVKAIAHDGTNASDVTETTFTKATKVTCAEAAEIASQLSGNNVLSDLYYVVVGYVTELDGTISNGQQKFWVSDTKGGANTLYSYWCNVPQELVVGDYIQMFGKLTKYYEKNQMKNGDVTILEEPTPEPVKYTVTVTAENGTVEGAGEYEEGTEITLTATPNEGYEFVNWTENEVEVSTDAEYTFEVLADRALVANFKKAAPATETVYFINTKKWAAVTAHVWGGKAAESAWPGKATVKETEKVAGYDVYSFTANVGDYANIIFNNNNGGSQTADLVWTAGKYYVIDMGWLTKEEAETKLAAPLPDAWNIVGDAGLMGKGWDLNAAENAMTKQEDGTYKLEKKDITLTAGTYEYKAAKDHGWDVSVPSGQTNQKLTISKSGIYDVTFVLDVTAKKLTATATLKKEAVVIPTVVIAGDMNSWNQTKDKFTMAADSLTATLKTTLTVKNYGFKMIVGGAWLSDAKTITRAANSTKFTGANGGNSTLKADIAGEYLFTWEYATKTLTVTYPELPVEYTVTATVNPAETGTVAGAGKYEEGKTATLTATPAEGYQFVNWTSGETVVSTENPYSFVVTADVALVANFKEVEPEIEWIEMPLEITNLVTEVMEVEGAKYLQLAGRHDMNDADVTLFLNNYADVDDDYEVNAEYSYMTFGGMEFTVIEGVMTQTSETDKGTIYTGTVYASVTDEEEGGTMYVKFALTMYAAPATVLELTDAIVAINEKLGTLTFNVPTGEGEGYYVELAGYTAPGVHEGPQICLLATPEVVAYTNYAETSVADGVITLKGEFVSPNGPKFDLTISGKLPGPGTALENIAVEGKAVKAIVNGQLIIIKNGVQYNAQGQVVK